jgi:Uma2 family endonuclease
MHTETLTEKSVEELIAELYRTEEKAEIINGEVVKFMSTGAEPGFAGDEIFASLREYAKRNKFGRAIGDNKAFLVNLPHRKSFSPDAAFYVGANPGMKFYEGAPVFAVEVRSENDYGKAAERRMANKRRDYFAAGTRIVWDVDLLSNEVVKSYNAENPSEPRVFARGETADAEPVILNWTIAVDDLFDLNG